MECKTGQEKFWASEEWGKDYREGNVVLCCYNLKGDLILGNIYEKFIKIKREFCNTKYTTLCRNCNMVSPHYLYKA